MRILLDSHVIIWWLTEPKRLQREAFEILVANDSELFASAASWWELSIKRAMGRLKFDADLVLSKLDEADVARLDVTFQHAEKSASLPAHHSDPFDRLLAAQAVCENLTLMTRDKAFAPYKISTIPV